MVPNLKMWQRLSSDAYSFTQIKTAAKAITLVLASAVGQGSLEWEDCRPSIHRSCARPICRTAWRRRFSFSTSAIRR